MYISLCAFSVDPEMTDRSVSGVGARFPPSSLRQVSILASYLPASLCLTLTTALFGTAGAFTRPLTVCSQTGGSGGSGGVASMVIYPLSFDTCFWSSFLCLLAGDRAGQGRSRG